MQTKVKTHGGKQISVLISDKTALSVIPHSRDVRTFSNVTDRDLKHAHNIFVVATALELPTLTDFLIRANGHKRLRALLIRQESYQQWIPQLLDKARVRMLRNLLVHSNNTVVKRILMAWTYGAQDKLISDAAVFADKLFVRDCALNNYEIRFDQMQDLGIIPAEERTNFVISEDGSRISWTKYNIDINLDSIKSAINPQPSKLALAKHDRIFGAAIAKLRKDRGIAQYEIPGLDERQLRRIESGRQHATKKSLQSLSKAHKLQLNHYLNLLGKYAKAR